DPRRSPDRGGPARPRGPRRADTGRRQQHPRQWQRESARGGAPDPARDPPGGRPSPLPGSLTFEPDGRGCSAWASDPPDVSRLVARKPDDRDGGHRGRPHPGLLLAGAPQGPEAGSDHGAAPDPDRSAAGWRSEERRVGKG